MRRIPLLLIAVLAIQTSAFAQARGRGGAPAPPQTPKAAAPIDLTGYWVSIVTEDWRYRMVTPAKGDYQGVPMTPEARKIADTWDPAKEEASGDVCKSYGAPAILRIPGRLHITWQDDQTLRLDADAGKQTRIFHFGNWKAPVGGPHTTQGDSSAEWEGGGRGATDGAMKIATTNLKAGFLRKNGVPYSDSTTMTEYYELITMPDGTPLLVVTISTTDPMYLRQPFVITSQFKKESTDAKWHPTDCSATW
ncbi:MAG TPA: hypothetical protein VLV86_17455 [Vicinamibacterales bacterium]|nr:hypothetical protein [Vicinamibacterales bacterium]